jgi:hypothetical protein
MFQNKRGFDREQELSWSKGRRREVGWILSPSSSPSREEEGGRSEAKKVSSTRSLGREDNTNTSSSSSLLLLPPPLLPDRLNDMALLLEEGKVTFIKLEEEEELEGIS